MTSATPARTTRRRRRLPWVVLGIIVVIAVLVVVAEIVARAVVPGVVRSVVIENLGLPADQQLEVSTPGMMLPQLLGGTLHEVRLSSDDVTIEGITGAAEVTATDVPIRGGELGSAEGTVAIDQAQFAGLLQRSTLPVTRVTLKEPNATLEGDVPVLGREVPVGITVTPGAQDGDLLITPVSLVLDGHEIDLAAVAGLLGGAAEQMVRPQRVCIADRLPAGITLTGLRVEGTRAVADIVADGRIAVDPALLEPGSCS